MYPISNLQRRQFMHDFEKFLNWYLGTRTRISRLWFNVIFFCAFIPVLALQFMNFQEIAMETADAMLGLQKSVEGIQLNGLDEAGSMIDQIQNTRDAASKFIDVTGLGSASGIKADKGLDIANILQLLILMALVPIIQMRLRDVGKTEIAELWVYSILIYFAVILDIAKVFYIDVPAYITAPAALISFFTVAWLCGRDSEHVIPPSER